MISPCTPCIKSKNNRTIQIPHDRTLYRQRHKIENMFGKLQDWRRIHTRHERRDGKKRVAGPPPQPSIPAIRQAILDLFARPPPLRCPHCKMLIAETDKQNLPK